MTEALHALAHDVGLLVHWEDAHGHGQTVGDDTLAHVLGTLGLATGSARAIADSRNWLREAQVLSARDFRTADVSARTHVPLAPGRAELVLEDGARFEVTLEAADGGSSFQTPDIPGYHRIETAQVILTLALAPRRGFGVREAGPRPRIWAPAVQVASLRSAQAQDFGHFGDVADAAEAFAAHGADAIAISPVHALFPADARRFSPYAPSTRLFLNALHADPATIDETFTGAAAGSELIDWSSAIPARLAALRALHHRKAGEFGAEIAAFAEAGGEDLALHARYDAFYAHFFAQDGRHGWGSWPPAYHDPKSAACEALAARLSGEVAFYLFLQWLADRSLDAAQTRARGAGMSIGLVSDLAVGMDAGGSHAWTRPDEILTGLGVGAPPDIYGPKGQNWGLTTFSPLALRRTRFEAFRATIRAALAHAGGVRIDHVLGLRRLWVVPDGAPPRDGVYLLYPQTDLFRLLALESHRARALVVGEDLGTVPPGFGDAMSERGLLGMRVLWFERGNDGAFKDPSAWDPAAAAMTSTHDLPTVAGWWTGRDIDWSWSIGRKGPFEDEASERAARAEDRARLWSAIKDAAGDPAADPPEAADPVVDAATAQVGRTACDLAIVPVEDLFGLAEQPNMPATIDEHPNWRRRLPAPVADLLAKPEIARRVDLLDAARGGQRRSGSHEHDLQH